MTSDLKRRLAVAGVGIPLGILLIHLGGWVLGVTLAVIAALGARELYALATANARTAGAGGGVRPFAAIGVAASALVVLAVAHDPVWERAAAAGWSLLLLVLLAALGAAVFRRGPDGWPLAATGATVAGVLYTGGTLHFALLIRHLPDRHAAVVDPWHGTFLLLFPLTAAWVGDAAAYFIGSRWGRRKLLPVVSPRKSVEGAVAGLAGSVLVGALFGALVLSTLPALAISPLAGAVIGLLVGMAAQVGDLAESVLKREAGVKDSGALLPGHGGVLDRFDGILVTLPLAYVLIVLNHWLAS